MPTKIPAMIKVWVRNKSIHALPVAFIGLFDVKKNIAVKHFLIRHFLDVLKRTSVKSEMP